MNTTETAQEIRIGYGHGHLPPAAADIAREHGAELRNEIEPARGDQPERAFHYFAFAAAGGIADVARAQALLANLKTAGADKPSPPPTPPWAGRWYRFGFVHGHLRPGAVKLAESMGARAILTSGPCLCGRDCPKGTCPANRRSYCEIPWIESDQEQVKIRATRIWRAVNNQYYDGNL